MCYFHMCTHTCAIIYIHSHVNSHMNSNMCIDMCTHTYTHTCVLLHINSHMRTLTCALTHVCSHMCLLHSYSFPGKRSESPSCFLFRYDPMTNGQVTSHNCYKISSLPLRSLSIHSLSFCPQCLVFLKIHICRETLL